MNSTFSRALRRIASTGPGVAVLVVAIGVGVAYSATNGHNGDGKRGDTTRSNGSE